MPSKLRLGDLPQIKTMENMMKNKWLQALKNCVFALGLAFTSIAFAGPVYVSLTFDDTHGNNTSTLPILAAAGFKATFYVNSARINTTSISTEWLTLNEIRAIQLQGHEIGGHTRVHSHLTSTLINPRNEICLDRVKLLEYGFNVTSLAYPYGEHDTNTKKIAKDCGYLNARGVSGIENAVNGETIPPLDPFSIRSFGSIKNRVTVDEMIKRIDDMQAAGGGWLPFIFHDVCDNTATVCNAQTWSISVTKFEQFIDRLKQNKQVKVITVADAINRVSNPSLDEITTNAQNEKYPTGWVKSTFNTPGGFNQIIPGRLGYPSKAWRMKNEISGDRTRRLTMSPTQLIPIAANTEIRINTWYKRIGEGQGNLKFVAYHVQEKDQATGYAVPIAESPVFKKIDSTETWMSANTWAVPLETLRKVVDKATGAYKYRSGFIRLGVVLTDVGDYAVDDFFVQY
jgi:peptidoglycan/xylan/chitin deacetylase (PgdA/CDA1 family)